MSLDQFGLVGPRYSLRPLLGEDYGALYRWATTPPTNATWRFSGSTPSPETFVSALWEGVLAQFAVVTRSSEGDGEIIGLVQAFNFDSGNRVAYLSVVVDPTYQRSSTAMAEGVVLFVGYLFNHFDLRKVYAETSDNAVGGLSRILQGWPSVTMEGRLVDHYYLGGTYADLVVLAIHRSNFVQDQGRLLRLVRTPTSSTASGPGLSFAEFVASLPSDLLPGLPECDHLSGGTRLVEDLHLDSLGLLELAVWIEDRFGGPVDLEPRLLTLEDLYQASSGAPATAQRSEQAAYPDQSVR